MLNHRDSQPALADHGTPVQDYVGPHAAVNLPPWQPAPIVPRKADESFSEVEMQAMRLAAAQEVDAKRAARIHMIVASVLTILLATVSLFTGSLFNLFLIGWMGWSVVHNWSANNTRSAVGDLAYRNARARSDAIFGSPSEDNTTLSKGNPYIKRFQRQSLVGIGLIALILVIVMVLSLQPDMTSHGLADVLGFVLGIGGGILLEYLTLCLGLGRLTEAQRQQQVDALLRRWLGQ